jgi:hypothetical protein
VTSAADPLEDQPMADELLSACTHMLAPAGWQPVAGHPSLLLRSNTALMSALRCSLTAGSVTVSSASMMFEEDRPLQLTMQPRRRDAFTAVCELLNRHAGELDRLDYAACVANLLRYVDRVTVECETTGLVPTVATLAGGGVRYQPARPSWPEPASGPLRAPYEGHARGCADSRERKQLNQRRAAGETELLPWEPDQYKPLSRLLTKDRRRNLSERLAYYEARQLLRPGDGFVRTIDGGRHAVWLPNDDSKGAFAYSIGLGYLYDLPEILLLSPMPAMIGATSRALALTVNAIAAALIGGLRLVPGDRYAAVADIVARTVHKECALDHAGLAQSCFVLPSPRIEERTLGAGAWFYANFMDAPSFPVLACLLQSPRIPDGYGLPPPPPPAKAKRAAAPAKPAKAPRTKSKRGPAAKRARPAAKKPATKKAAKKSRKTRARRR